jgi:Fic family protein
VGEPPKHFLVSEEVAHLCAYVNDNWDKSSALHLAAYVLWRLNWIHPFADGNGRTARAVSNVVLNVKLDSLLPGAPSIPEQISNDKKPYYDALEEADRAWTAGKIDVSVLEGLLSSMLARQLLDAIKQAAEAPASTAALEDQTKST